MDRYIVTFDKSNEDIPTLVVSKENYFSLMHGMDVVQIFTGDEAVRIWNKLSIKVEESEDFCACNTCKHKNDSWDSNACDGCCAANSHFESEEQA